MSLLQRTGGMGAKGFGLTGSVYKPGSETYTTAGTYTFVVPADVYSLSVD
jgi:hypothetical protein